MKSSFYKDEQNGPWQVYAGCVISNALAEAKEMAAEVGEVAFEFNGVRLVVASDSDLDLIYRDWERALKGYISGTVGPSPAGSLTAEEMAHDAEVEAVNEQRRKEAQQAFAREMAERDRAANEKLVADPGFQSTNPAEWARVREINSHDGYSNATMQYAERWARLMQVEISAGKPLEQIAEQCSHAADVEGITGFMYGCAVHALSTLWIHGEQLRRWHNLTTQIRNEGERANETGAVLNPAVLCIGGE